MSATLELLAPARNAMTAIEAVRHGADAVYIGSPSHGARVSAANSLEDIRRVVEYAHRFRSRVYVTLNTLVYEDEIPEVEKLVHSLYAIGVDALIVQDMSLLRMNIPPIALHASTQCDIRTPQKARFLQDAGFSQLVLPRELTLQEIRAIREVTTVPLEAFVHGALCVSYSGDCQASFVTTGRSANRGECAQICRWEFDLIDGDGRVVEKSRHLLSLRDMNRSRFLPEMAEAGIGSFKIEGRLKDVAYVKDVTAYYSSLLDRIVTQEPRRYRRESVGVTELCFTPQPEKAFNRRFTPYFLTSPKPGAGTLASFDTPKFIGSKVGVVSANSRGLRLTVKLDTPVANGDGLTYTDRDGKMHGFRVNRVEGNSLILRTPLFLPKGTPLYRNLDRERERLMDEETAVRYIPINVTLRALPWGIALEAKGPDGTGASVAMETSLEEARQPQAGRHEAAVRKCGDTVYRVERFDDTASRLFIPASQLSALRRRLCDALDRCFRATHPYDYRRPDEAGDFPEAVLTRHDNVANSLAEQFYAAHGAQTGGQAVEVSRKLTDDRVVMTTRYCLRRELGRCLLTPEGKLLKGPLTLRSGNHSFPLSFDCSSCRMQVLK